MFNINRIARNLLSVGFSNIFSQFITFLIITYAARILGKEGFGVINLAQVITLYLSTFTIFGLQTFGIREISKDRKEAKRIISEIVSTRFLMSIIAFAVLVLITVFINKPASFKLLLVLYGLTLFPIAINTDWFFSGIQEMQHNAVYNIIRNIVPYLLLLVFLKDDKNINLIPAFTLLGLILGVIYQNYVIRFKEKISFTLLIKKATYIKCVRCGIPFLLSSMLAMVNSNIDKVIMGFTRSEGELGLYSAGYNIIFFLINVIAIIFTVIFPLFISYYHEKKWDELSKICNFASRLICLIAVPILFGGLLLSKDIIVLLFGIEYTDGYKPFMILIVYIFILFIREIYGYQLNAWNMEKEYLKAVGISSGLNFLFNLILIPLYGMFAAAWVTTLSEVINLILMREYAALVFKTGVFMNILKSSIPAFIMALSILALKYLNINVVIIIAAAVLVYFASAFLTRIISIREFKMFISKREGV